MGRPAAATMLLCLASVLLSGCSAVDEPLQEQRPTGRIDGAVLDHVLFPYANVTVHLVELELETRTTQLGGFSFYNLPPDFYTLEVDLPGIGMDREIVAVQPEQVSKVILQVFAPRPDRNYVAELSWLGTDDVGEPGSACDRCDWRAALRERRPNLVVAAAVWPEDAVFDTFLTMEVRTPDGDVLLGPLGPEDTVVDEVDGIRMRHLGGYIDGDDIPEDAGSLLYHFEFSDQNLLPHVDFQMESFLWVHYGVPEPTDDAQEYL